MTNFIKFSNCVLNTLKINKIEFYDKSYLIHLTNNSIDGFFLFTSGYINSNTDKIKVCKIEHPADYKVLSDWIDKIQ